MALPSQTLASIQAAGAAIYQADLALKEAVKRYSDLTQNAMLENPFDIGNNALFADWTTIARLSRAVSQVESEFVKIYTSASAMSDSTSPAVLQLPSLTAPETSISDLAIVQEIEATDVVEKKLSKKATESTPTSSLKGNSAKLLARLTTILNQENFVKLNRSAVGEEIGLPKGSVGASITKLLQAGYLIEGGFGEFKLTRPKPGM